MPILHWLTREEDLKTSGQAPYRLIEPVDEYSYGDMTAGNMLIQGDNLDALKALLPCYAGSVKCVYIDPPFNTEQAFEHYDDNIEHSLWLSIMYPKLELIRELVSEEGTIFIHIDDKEMAYLTIIADEIFGRENRLSIVTFKQGAPTGHKAINKKLVTITNYILIYSKNRKQWSCNRIFTAKERDQRYSQYIVNIEDNFNNWKTIPLSKAFSLFHNKSISNLKKEFGESFELELTNFVISNSDKVIRTARPDYNKVGSNVKEMIDNSIAHPDNIFLLHRQEYPDMYFKKGERWLFYKDKLKSIDGELVSGEPLTNLWDDLLSNNLHNEGNVSFPKGKKPEGLIKRVIEFSTNAGDLVLDSFLGSGTTVAVAHKMNRRYIGIEMGDHAITHCVPRLKNVIHGEQWGVSKDVNWTGGGGFRFYRLGVPVFDDNGSIRQGITFAQLGAHVWFSETKTPLSKISVSPLLGVHCGIAYYLLFNGILKDKSVNGGNVLTSKILEGLPVHDGPKVIYGERCLFSANRLKECQITFKHTPYDIKGR